MQPCSGWEMSSRWELSGYTMESLTVNHSGLGV